MKLPNKPIKSATIFFSGDPSVGIPRTEYSIELYIFPNMFSPKEMGDYLKDVKQRISDLYKLLEDEKPTVLFDFEIEEINKKEEELINSMVEEEQKGRGE